MAAPSWQRPHFLVLRPNATCSRLATESVLQEAPTNLVIKIDLLLARAGAYLNTMAGICGNLISFFISFAYDGLLTTHSWVGIQTHSKQQTAVYRFASQTRRGSQASPELQPQAALVCAGVRCVIGLLMSPSLAKTQTALWSGAAAQAATSGSCCASVSLSSSEHGYTSSVPGGLQRSVQPTSLIIAQFAEYQVMQAP